MPVVGKDIAHDSACTHVTGESVFLDDLPPLSGELIVGIVPSPVAHGELESLDVSAAGVSPGVVAVITSREVPGHNRLGPVVKDEDLLVSKEIVFLGQPLAIIGATSTKALDAARAAIIADIETLPPIFSIDEALAAGSLLDGERRIERGAVDEIFGRGHRLIEGSLDIGGQEHFYLESQVAIAVPGEQGCMTVHSSTQHPSEVQMMVAEALGVAFHKVICICKRMGGGFGGKETQAAQPAIFAALVAAKTGRPARFVYTKDDDMRYTGKRHPFKTFYKVAYDTDGRILAIDLRMFANGGCSTDLSFAVVERAVLHSDNTSYLPACRIVGRVCRTNLPSNTAFRGFGGPQGVAGIECVLDRIASALGRDPLDVRQANCYESNERNTTPYEQVVQNNTLPELFDTLRRECEYDRRRAEIGAHNSGGEMEIRGMALSGVKFGISFTRRTLNQANALVHVYTDGSVVVSTGATEMGQGVNTRVRQIVADELGVGYDRVIVGSTSTEKNHTTSPTAASSGTDLNGAAAADACARIRQRLAHVAAGILAIKGDAAPSRIRFAEDRVFDERQPGRSISFAQVACEAYEQRVSLGERGFYVTPGVDYDRATGRGTPFLYFTNGAACAEVAVNRFTGEVRCTRVDLLMDVGKSINPGIDRGQIVGGFIQGMGWVTGEELVYGDDGQLLSNSPTTYKIPNISDLPDVFNVRFLDNPHNAVSLRRSKAVGEPPLLLGICVWLAARDALRAIAIKSGDELSLPATHERILLAIESATGCGVPAPPVATITSSAKTSIAGV